MKEPSFYRQLCHLGSVILVTLEEGKTDYGPILGAGRLFRITWRYISSRSWKYLVICFNSLLLNIYKNLSPIGQSSFPVDLYQE